MSSDPPVRAKECTAASVEEIRDSEGTGSKRLGSGCSFKYPKCPGRVRLKQTN